MNQIGRIERGENNPLIETTERIASALEVSITMLMDNIALTGLVEQNTTAILDSFKKECRSG